jgi:hypothetical protein
VEAWGELLPWVQVQVLFENMARGWSYKTKGTFGGKKLEMLCVALNAHRMYGATFHVSYKASERGRSP